MKREYYCCSKHTNNCTGRVKVEKKICLVKMVKGKPFASFLKTDKFIPLTAQFDHKPLNKVVEMLEKLPANSDTEFVIDEK